MHSQIVSEKTFDAVCQQLLAAYFARFPKQALQDDVCQSLEKLRARQEDMPGEPGGWAGGLLYTVATRKRLEPLDSLNADMEEIFGVCMGTIRKRAARIYDVLYPTWLPGYGLHD